MIGLKLIKPPEGAALTLEEAKRHLRVERDDENDDIDRLIAVASERAEDFLNRKLMTQTWMISWDRGEYLWVDSRGVVKLPFPPLQAVDSIKYTDAAGVEQTIDPAYYQVDIVSEPGRIAPAAGMVGIWPWLMPSLLPIAPALSAIRVQFKCGYSENNPMPLKIKQAMLLMLGHFYENREAVLAGLRAAAIEIPLGAESLMWASREISVV